MRSFEEILRDVENSCKRVLGSTTKSDVMDSATKIYIAELQVERLKNSK